MLVYVVMVCLSAIYGCETVPYTDRSQLVMMSLSEEVALGDVAYRESLQKASIVHNPRQVEVVKRVANRIIKAAQNSHFSTLANQFYWEVNVIENSEPSAFALPGGKIMVYTGILPITKNDDGLAVILGHEVAHALARHGAERITQALLVNASLTIAEVALLSTSNNEQDTENKRLALAALGLGAQYGLLLPYSRAHESEADHIGLLLAAQAGFSPHEAIKVWERMSTNSSGQGPEFLSSHPNHETRIQQFEEWMPEASAIYEQFQQRSVVKENIQPALNRKSSQKASVPVVPSKRSNQSRGTQKPQPAQSQSTDSKTGCVTVDRGFICREENDWSLVVK